MAVVDSRAGGGGGGEYTYAGSSRLCSLAQHQSLCEWQHIHRLALVRSNIRKILRMLLSPPSARKVFPVPSKHRTSSLGGSSHPHSESLSVMSATLVDTQKFKKARDCHWGYLETNGIYIFIRLDTFESDGPVSDDAQLQVKGLIAPGSASCMTTRRPRRTIYRFAPGLAYVRYD